MALTVTRPKYWLLKLTTNASGVFNFKYVVFLKDSDGGVITTFKTSGNRQGVGFIDFERVVKSYLKVTNKHANTIPPSVVNIQYDSIHLIPNNRTKIGTTTYDYPLSKNTDTLQTFTFDCYESYSTTEGGVENLNNLTSVSYPLINFSNEWEDKMEFDADKFSLNENIVSQMADPNFSSGTSDWNPSTNATISHLSSEMTVTTATGQSDTKIYTSNAQLYEGKEYILRYDITSTTDVTLWRYWNGKAYISAPFTDGVHYVKFTALKNFRFYLNTHGLENEVVYNSIDLFEVNEESSFLTDLPAYTTKPNITSGLIPHLTSFNDKKTLAFINTDENGFDTQDGRIEYKFFSEAPVFETVKFGYGAEYQVPTNYIGRIDVDNDATNGSITPSTASTDEESLVYLGVGGANVKNINYEDKGNFWLDEDSVNQSGVKYYTVTYTKDQRIFKMLQTVDKLKKGDRVYINVLGDTEWHSFVAETKPVSEINSNDVCYIASLGDTNWQNFGAPAGATVGTVFTSTSSSVTGTGEVVIQKRTYYINSSNVTGTGVVEIWYGVPISKTYLFELASDLNCNTTRFNEYTLAWKNKYGTWDYYMFDGEHSEVRNYKRKLDYERLAGGWNETNFTLDSYERGKVQKVEGTKETTVNTRFITDDYNDYFNGLLMSNEVLLLPKIKPDYSNVYDAAIPVNIKNTSLTYKTNLKNKLVQYSFTYEYAHDLKQRV